MRDWGVMGNDVRFGGCFRRGGRRTGIVRFVSDNGCGGDVLGRFARRLRGFVRQTVRREIGVGWVKGGEGAGGLGSGKNGLTCRVGPLSGAVC